MTLSMITGLGTSVVKTGVGLIFGSPERKNNLDPMITMIQLGMLGFMKTGTKIGFYENCLQIQRPGWSQTYARSTHQDQHTELDKLEQIVKDAIRFYRPSQDELIREIFSHAAEGLKQLRNTYLKQSIPNVPGTLAHVISIIETNIPPPCTNNNLADQVGESSESQTKKNKQKKVVEVEPKAEITNVVPGNLIVVEEEENKIPQIMKKVIAIWNKDAYREVIECFNLIKEKQGDVLVDVQEKGIRELELLQSFIAHKVNRLNYVLDAEMHMTSI